MFGLGFNFTKTFYIVPIELNLSIIIIAIWIKFIITYDLSF